MRAVVVLPTPRTPVSIQACGMRPALEGVRDRAHHRVLADQIGEGRRPVFARQHAIGGRSALVASFIATIVARVERSEIRRSACEPVGGPAFRCAQSRATHGTRMRGWEADERPEPRSLGLLPSGPDPVGEWLVHRQPPGPYIGRGRGESKLVFCRLISGGRGRPTRNIFTSSADRP